MKLWIALSILASKYWRLPFINDTKASDDARLRALQLKGKGKKKYPRYRKPRGY